jgi:hypothetical protein
MRQEHVFTERLIRESGVAERVGPVGRVAAEEKVLISLRRSIMREVPEEFEEIDAAAGEAFRIDNPKRSADTADGRICEVLF